jgi:hypothetical protein
MIIILAFVLDRLDIGNMLIMLDLERVQIKIFVFEVKGIPHGLVCFLGSLRDDIRDVSLRMG